MADDFSLETMQMRRQWDKVFTELKGKTIHAGLLYPGKYFSKMKVNKGFQMYKN